jgi:hypothetical protein
LKCEKNYFCPLRAGTEELYNFSSISANEFTCGDGFQCLTGAMDARPMPPIAPGSDVGPIISIPNIIIGPALDIVVVGANQGAFCSAGNYCSKDVVGMKECDAGSYQPNQGATECLPVPAGTFTFIAGTTTTYVPCPSGYYCAEGSYAPKACPSGRYGPTELTNLRSAEDCLLCPAGYYCQ